MDQTWSRVSFSVGRTKNYYLAANGTKTFLTYGNWSHLAKFCGQNLSTRHFSKLHTTFLVRNLSRNLPRVYWKIGKNIRDAVGLGCGKEKRLETLWGKKNTNEVTKGRGIHNHRKSNRWSWFWCTEFIEKFIWGVRIYSFYEINCFSRILWK